MSDSPNRPYGFHPDFIPPGMNQPDQYSGMALSYGMPMQMPMPSPVSSLPPVYPDLSNVNDEQSTAPTLPSSSSSSSSSSSPSSPSVKDEKQNYLNFDYSMYESFGYSWQHCFADHPFPTEVAVRAGRDADGSPIFVGRCFHEGDMIPAKVIPDKNIAYVAYGGEEIPKYEWEILRTGSFAWEFAMNGEVPNGAIEVGRTADGEKLYMGRCLYNGTQTPGKIQVSHGCLYIPFDGEEVSQTEYEVLVLK